MARTPTKTGSTYRRLENYVGGRWIKSVKVQYLPVENPATGETIAEVPISGKKEISEAVASANGAFPEWKDTPAVLRSRFLFHLKELMEESKERLAIGITEEHGKTISDARGEVRRAIENVEVASGMPSLYMGYGLDNIAKNIDSEVIRQPLGTFGIIGPYNFPLMVPLWFIPYAIACGNTVVVKPSEQTPISQQNMAELIDQIGLPPGVFNMVHGAKEAVNGLIEDPGIAGISFVGSTPIARHVYTQGSANGKRVQCGGGAKNFLVVMPDADLDLTIDGLMSSLFGAAGQRCLAGSVVVTVGKAYKAVRDRLVEGALRIKLGPGLNESTEMGPVISGSHLQRVLNYVESGLEEGAELLVDRRHPPEIKEFGGHFIGPCVFDNVLPSMKIAREEIFGPIASIIKVNDLNEAVDLIAQLPYGNAASIFTGSGYAAREFKRKVNCGNIGINIGVAAPMAFFPFGGMKASFFGSLHPQGREGIEFFTDRKTVISRWS